MPLLRDDCEGFLRPGALVDYRTRPQMEAVLQYSRDKASLGMFIPTTSKPSAAGGDEREDFLNSLNRGCVRAGISGN
jgi:hypothetical protein